MALARSFAFFLSRSAEIIGRVTLVSLNLLNRGSALANGSRTRARVRTDADVRASLVLYVPLSLRDYRRTAFSKREKEGERELRYWPSRKGDSGDFKRGRRTMIALLFSHVGAEIAAETWTRAEGIRRNCTRLIDATRVACLVRSASFFRRTNARAAVTALVRRKFHPTPIFLASSDIPRH